MRPRRLAVVVPSDAEAIATSLTDPQAFVPVFDRHFDRIQAYLRRRLPSALADDLAAETFAVAFDKRASYDPGRRDAAPWLFGIAANLVRRHRRREARELRAVRRGRREPSAPPDGGAEARADARAAGPAIAAALARLHLRDREVLLLFAWAELGYDEIAAALGIPAGTVRSRLNRARRLVRHSLGEDGLLDDPTEAC